MKARSSSRLLVGVLGAIVVAPLAARSAFAADDEAKLAEVIRSSLDIDEKRQAAKKLAARKNAAARKELVKLLEEDRFTGEIALYGLILLEDREADVAALDFLDDNYISCDEAVEAVKVRKSFTIELLSKRYPTTTKFQARVSYVKIACAAPSKESEKFLLDVMKAKVGQYDNEARDARSAAFEGLIAAGSPEVVRPIALELAKADDDLAAPALGFLVEKGTAADLPLALAAIERKKPSEALLAVAYRGVGKWADPKVKREKLLAALRSDSEERHRAAIATLDVVDPEATVLLCRIVRKAESQQTRIAAAKRLTKEPAAPAGKRDPVIAALVGVLKETFAPLKATSIAANFLTLGLAGIADYLGHEWDQKAFDADMELIVAALEKRAGAKPASHESWLEWAVLHGYTVDGTNLMQLVFSPDKAKRRQAQEGAAVLLGFKSRDEFIKKTPGLAAEDGPVGVALAQKLVEKGLLVDED